MLEKKKKLCPECEEIHKNMNFDELAEEFADSIFPKIWKQGKKDLKEMSKKKLLRKCIF